MQRIPLSLVLAVLLLIGLAAASIATAAPAAPCDLSRTTSVAQARISATCVRGQATMRRISREHNVAASLRVAKDACTERSRTLAVCTFTVAHGGAPGYGAGVCTGRVSVRGFSTYPRRLRVRVVGFACTT